MPGVNARLLPKIGLAWLLLFGGWSAVKAQSPSPPPSSLPFLEARVIVIQSEITLYHLQIVTPPPTWQGTMPNKEPSPLWQASMPVLRPQGILGTNAPSLFSTTPQLRNLGILTPGK